MGAQPSAQPCAQSPRTTILRCTHKCAQPLRAQPLRTTFAHNPRAQGQPLCAQGFFFLLDTGVLN